MFYKQKTSLFTVVIFAGVFLHASSLYPKVSINKADLVQVVTELTSQPKPRNYRNVSILNALSQSIHNRFKSFGYAPRFQNFTVRNNNYRNVVACIGPKKAAKLIVGAHYDSHGETPGADDNATGVAGLITLAKLLKPYESKLKYQVEFVAFTLEEPPFFRSEKMGSYIHAKSINDGKTEVLGMICLEMIGYFTKDDNSQDYPVTAMKLLYPSVGDFIAVVSNISSRSLGSVLQSHMGKADIEVQRLVSPSSLPGVDFSDHLNYWKFDYPAVMITDTAFFRNKNYHKSTDTIDTINFTKMKEVILGAFYGILNLTIDNFPQVSKKKLSLKKQN